MIFSELFVTVLKMSAVASIMALVVMMLRRIAGRTLSRGLMLALWGVVILKLLIPFSVPSPVSLYNVVDIEEMPVFITSSLETELPLTPELPVVVLPSTDADVIPVTPITPVIPSVESGTVSPVVPDVNDAEPSPVLPDEQIPDVPTVQQTAPTVPVPEITEKASVDPLTVIGTVYCIVAGGALLAVVFAYLFTACRIGKSETVKDERIFGILGKLESAQRIRVKKREGQRSIMIFGILRPTVILPEDYKSLSDTELTYLLMHEYQHYRHFDTLWNLLMLIACAVHWFNPFVWLTRRFFLCDMETACDARVLRRLPEGEKSVFAEVLVSFAARCSGERSIAAMGFGKRNVKERVLSVMKYKKTGVVAVIASLVILALVISVFATGAAHEITENTPVAEETSEETTDGAKTDPEETEPAETEPLKTEPEESIVESTEAETEAEPVEDPISVVVTDRNNFRSELSALAENVKLSADGKAEAVLEFSDIADFKLTVTVTKESDGTVATVNGAQYKGQSYSLDFSEILKKYPGAVLDVVSAGGFVSVGMRNSLGTYYVFTEAGSSLFEMTDDAGFYVWSDGNSLWYMKQNLAFEYISGGMPVFAQSYSSPEQFYMDYGKIVFFTEGTLNVTKTSWTVQDYFMSDSFVMAAERDGYGYTSVKEFVADYKAGRLGLGPELVYSADKFDLVLEDISLAVRIPYDTAFRSLRDYMISNSDNAEGEANRAVRIGSKDEFDSFVSAVDSFSPFLLQQLDKSTYDEEFFADSALVVISVIPDNTREYNITLNKAVLYDRSLVFEVQTDLPMNIEPRVSNYREDGTFITYCPYRAKLYGSRYLFFVRVNRAAFEYADHVSVQEYRTLTPHEYLYKDGEYKWTESYRNEPFKDILRCGNIEDELKASADNIDKLVPYENQFPVRVFETYDELFDFILDIDHFKLNMDVFYQLVEHYDRNFFINNSLVIAVGHEVRDAEASEETDIEFYYEIVNGKMTVYVHDLTGTEQGGTYLRFYNIPHSNLAGVTDFACQYDAATLGEDAADDTYNGEIQPIDAVEIHSRFDNPYGNVTPADLSQYMYKPVTAQPSSPVIPLYPDPAPKVMLPTVP